MLMKAISANQLVEIIGGKVVADRDALSFDGVSIDSRTIQPGQAFFAIAGENFDGHDYVASAIEKGACCVVAEIHIDLPNGSQTALIKVDDCIEALTQLASWYRQQLSARVIAITGSVGKTTTRQIMHQVLSRFFKCRQARGSFNNHIGVPLTILSAEPDDIPMRRSLLRWPHRIWTDLGLLTTLSGKNRQLPADCGPAARSMSMATSPICWTM
jgi:UDP-N-acetylmuramoyl-tripeptide--D-alanyl-D-alanine ligase